MPIVMFLALLVVLVPVVFFASAKRVSSDLKTTDDVTNIKGVAFSTEGYSFIITVKALGTWELSEYLCKNDDECRESLTSGTKLQLVSGGPTSGKEVVLNLSPGEVSGYSSVKVFVRSDWMAGRGGFRIESLGDVVGTRKFEIKQDGVLYSLVLIPLVKDGAGGGPARSVVFTD